MIVLSAPSGGGKTTICRAILERMPHIDYSISFTTRSPRNGEEEGKSYFFISEEEFKKKIDSGDLLEYAKVHDNWYGTSRSFILDKFSCNRNVIMDIDVQGAAEIIDKDVDCVTVFLVPPDLRTLKHRLNKRGTDTPQAIELRLKNAVNELRHISSYQYVVINDDLELAINDVRNIIKAEHNRTHRYVFEDNFKEKNSKR